MENLKFNYNDGGREAAGYKGKAGDCVCRAIAIITGKPYQEVYDALADGNANQRQAKHNGRKSSIGSRTARNGIMTNRKWFDNYMVQNGFVWTPTMLIGQGCKVHLRADELPKGRLVVSVSRHMVAVIDGVVNDTYDCTRDGGRCVYGYYTYTGNPIEPKKAEMITEVEYPKVKEPSKDIEKLEKLLTAKKKWMSKAKRAETALMKLNKKIKYYQKKTA